MKGRPIYLLLIYMLSVILSYSHSLDDQEEHQQGSMRLELIHRHAPNNLGERQPKTQLERIKELLQHDIIRQSTISYRRHLSQKNTIGEAWEMPTTSSGNGGIRMPIYAGRDYGTGLYFTQLRVGTPSQKFKLIVDTGSELTWLNCRYQCGDNCTKEGARDQRSVFRADLSSSFKTIPCFSRFCKVGLMNLFSLTTCPTPLAPCSYDYRYSDGSSALGIFANETVTAGLNNGKKTNIHKVLIGCSGSFQGFGFDKADGVMGLAYSKYSFTSKATEKFGGKFSYCLVDHLSHKNVSNYLIFGAQKNRQSFLSNMRYTKLELGLITPFYAVNVLGISVGGVMLKIPFGVWDANLGGGTILDSGTSLTYLTMPAYKPVMASLEKSLTKLKRIDLEGVPMKYCFNSTGFDESLVPRVTIHFIDGARFEPHLKSYVVDVADGVKCLGFVPANWPGTNVIGNIMQQNYLWQFDLVRPTTLGFAASTCA
ncbi:Asp domain-containing protein [Cephalotus follicularis]|uniref:Asp domain-containing protein n=1 Tax=Cephalotus follicularis TaxID=3775 RepID=A0A1Q3BA34_CEPFO|nr:Asp domain-containing protein [Cephalotus follicularis]